MQLPATVTSLEPAASDAAVLENISENIAISQALLASRELVREIGAAAAMIVRVMRNQGRMLLAGNGGSAADAQHIAAEFVGRYRSERQALPVLALTVNTSVLTAIGNDYGFEDIFSRQVEAFARAGDILLVLSTSGNSANVLRAVKTASQLCVRTIALTGQSGGKLKNAADLCLCVPSSDTPRIQEAHILIGHTLSEIVERELLPGQVRSK